MFGLASWNSPVGIDFVYKAFPIRDHSRMPSHCSLNVHSQILRGSLNYKCGEKTCLPLAPKALNNIAQGRDGPRPWAEIFVRVSDFEFRISGLLTTSRSFAASGRELDSVSGRSSFRECPATH